MSELNTGMGNLNRHVCKNIDGFQGVHGGSSIGKINQEGRMLLEFCDAKHSCIANTWLRKADKKRITNGSGWNKSEIDFCIMGKVDCKLLKNVKVITGEVQHSLVIGDIVKKQENKTEWKSGSQKRNVAKLRDEPYRQLFECRIKESMYDNHNDLWESVKKSVLKACDEVCEYKKNRKCNEIGGGGTVGQRMRYKRKKKHI